MHSLNTRKFMYATVPASAPFRSPPSKMVLNCLPKPSEYDQLNRTLSTKSNIEIILK